MCLCSRRVRSCEMGKEDGGNKRRGGITFLSFLFPFHSLKKCQHYGVILIPSPLKHVTTTYLMQLGRRNIQLPKHPLTSLLLGQRRGFAQIVGNVQLVFCGFIAPQFIGSHPFVNVCMEKQSGLFGILGIIWKLQIASKKCHSLVLCGILKCFN